MSDEERNRLWDQKLSQQQQLARTEDIEAEAEARRLARSEKIRQRDERLLREIKEIDRKGTEAAIKLTKTGKKAAKGFAKDMWKATKVAAKGLGDWADRVAPDEKAVRGRRKTKAKMTAKKPKTVTRTKTATRVKPKFSGDKRGLPEFVTINGKKYTRAGTFGDNADKARNYALSLKSHGLDAKAKKLSNGVVTVWTVWYRPKAPTTTARRKRKTSNAWY